MEELELSQLLQRITQLETDSQTYRKNLVWVKRQIDEMKAQLDQQKTPIKDTESADHQTSSSEESLGIPLILEDFAVARMMAIFQNLGDYLILESYLNETKEQRKVTQVQELLKACKAGERNFDGIDLSSADLSNLSLPGVSFREANLKNASFENSNLENTDLSYANLVGVNFRKASLKAAKLIQVNANKADFTEASLIQASLTAADLTESVLHLTDVTYAQFIAADLRKANTKNLGNTYNASFRGAILRELNLVGKILSCDFRDADLSYAKLCGSNLTHTQLSYVDLRGADLRGAKLQKANLEGANLQGAIGVDFGERSEMAKLGNTIMPDGTIQG